MDVRKRGVQTAWSAFLCGAALAAFGAEDAPTFKRDILPVFQERCGSCHGAEARVRGLLLDSAEGAREAIERGILAAGKPDDSPLYRRVTLPRDAPGAMPPPGAGEPLSDAQKETIRRWIADGALVTAPESAPTDDDPTDVPFAPPEAVRALQDAGALVRFVAEGLPWLDVDFSQSETPVGDDALRLVEAVAAQTRFLNLSRTGVTDAGLVRLAGCVHLRSLRLDHGEITGAGLAHLARLPRLDTVNLFRSKLIDDGLEALASLTALKRVYIGDAWVSTEGIERLANARPDLIIDVGLAAKSPVVAWTPDQLAAWSAALAPWGLLDHKDWSKIEPSLPENWIGWFEDDPAPRTMREWRPEWEAFAKNHDVSIWRLRPVSVAAVSGAGVVQADYYVSAVEKATGKRIVLEGRTVETVAKNGDRWMWLSSVRKSAQKDDRRR